MTTDPDGTYQSAASWIELGDDDIITAARTDERTRIITIRVRIRI